MDNCTCGHNQYFPSPSCSIHGLPKPIQLPLDERADLRRLRPMNAVEIGNEWKDVFRKRVYELERRCELLLQYVGLLRSYDLVGNDYGIRMTILNELGLSDSDFIAAAKRGLQLAQDV